MESGNRARRGHLTLRILFIRHIILIVIIELGEGMVWVNMLHQSSIICPNCHVKIPLRYFFLFIAFNLENFLQLTFRDIKICQVISDN